MTGGAATRLAVAFNGGLALCLALLWGHAAWRGELWRADFTAFYLGWSLVASGDGAHVYDLDAQARRQPEVVPERGPDGGLLPFNSAPHFAVGGSPLAWLPRPGAYWLWAAAQVCLAGVLLGQFDRLLPGHRPVLFSAVLGFPPLMLNFQHGQVGILLTACLAGLALALERGRNLPAAGWFALATLKPQLAVTPAVLLLAGRRWRVLAWAAALLAPGLLISTLVLGPHCWPDYLAHLGKVSRDFDAAGVNPTRMYGLKAALAGLLGPGQVPLVNGLALAGVAGGATLAAVLFGRRWPEPGPDYRLRFALALQVGLLANPHFNPHDALAYAVPAVLYASALPAPGARVAALLLGLPLLFLLDAQVPHWPGGIRPFFVAMLALAGLIAWALRTAGGNGIQQQGATSGT